MPTYDDIKAQLARLGITGMNAQQAGYKALAPLLHDGETIEAAQAGDYEGTYGALVATSERVIFVGIKLRLGANQVRSETFNYDAIISVQAAQSFAFASIEVATAGGKTVLTKADKQTALGFAETVMRRVRLAKAAPAAPVVTDLASQLERLAALRDRGVLTEEEFQQQKRKLLD